MEKVPQLRHLFYLVCNSNIRLHVFHKSGDIYSSAALECEVTVVTCLLDSLEYVDVVDFAGTGLVSIGVVSDVEVTDMFSVIFLITLPSVIC